MDRSHGLTSAGGRIEAVQGLRGIAVLLVIALHAIELIKFRHALHGDALGLLSQPVFYDHFGASGVDLFFVISGFVMAHVLERTPTGDWGGFLRARAIRILPLYWLATIAMVGLLLVLAEPISAASIVASVLVFPVPGRMVLDAPVLVVGWSLAFECAFYLALVPTLFVAAHRRPVLALSIVGGLAGLGQMLAPRDNLLALFLNPIWYAFAFGLLIQIWWRRGIEPGLARLAGIAGLLLLGAGIFAWVVPETRPFAIYDEGAGLTRAIFWAMPYAGLLASALTARPFSALMLRLGDASYSLYLTHMLMMTAMLHVPQLGFLPADLLSATAVTVSLLLGVWIHKKVEVPLLRWLRHGSAQKSTLPAVN